jgi:glycosyltransferase involved in cell wall biosynthesis
MRLSVIIPNYNYGEFVGHAIESALALDWPDVEIIVVDDGSTDHSAKVIRSYGNKVTAIFQSNATQRVACNRGFEVATGDFIIFLDSDDMLDPAVAREAAAVWGPHVSKVQFQMMRVDHNGVALHSVFPAFAPMPTPKKLRDWSARGLAMPTPPGSGNVYARRFLEKIFPLDDSCGSFSDSACVAAAPFFGDVVTVAKPLVSYRMHGRNDSRVPDDSRFAREILRAKARFKFAGRFRKNDNSLKDASIFNSIEVLQFRVASLKLRPDIHPVAGDSVIRALRDAVRLFFESSSSRLNLRGAVLIWSFLTLLSPRGVGRKLVELRYR